MDALELLQAVRDMVRSYNCDSSEEFQDATEISNQIIAIVRRNDELLERGK